MQHFTHTAGSVVAVTAITYWSATSGTPLSPALTGTFAASALIGGLLNDLDSPTSKIRHMLHCAGESSGPNHRGVLHWPILYIPMLFVIVALTNSILQAALFGLFVGLEMHLVLDSLNPVGIRWLAPLSLKTHRLLRIRTGSIGETILFIMLLLIEGYMIFRLDWTMF